MPKTSRMFRLNPELYGRFKSLVSVSGYTVTGALEKFMGCCVERGALQFLGRAADEEGLQRALMKDNALFSLGNVLKTFICGDIVELIGCTMNVASIVAIIFGLGFVVAAWGLYVLARRASPDRRYFRLSAYAEMVVLTFSGIVFIVIGILASQ